MTTATQTYTTLTAIQFYRAHQLARAFGHTWGGIDAPKSFDSYAVAVNPADPTTEIALEAIHQMAYDSKADGDGDNNTIWGILAPTVDEDGDVVHTTGFGRLDWRVDRQGNVGFTINRPYVDPSLDWVVATARHVTQEGDSPLGLDYAIERRQEARDAGTLRVLRAILRWDAQGNLVEDTDYIWDVAPIDVWVDFYPDHVSALFDAIAALIPARTAARLLAPLFVAAKTRPTRTGDN